jgi:hypothetical protein
MPSPCDSDLFSDAEFQKCSQICQRYFRSHDAVIRVYDHAGNVVETHEHAGDFNRSLYLLFGAASFGALDADRTSDRAGVVQEWQVRFKKHNSQDTSDRAFDNLGY